MKILLIEPSLGGYTFTPSLSLASLKGFINKKTKHEAKIIDLVFSNKKWKKLLNKKIKEEKPEIIGISVLSFNYPEALKIAGFLKFRFNIPIIFGGIHTILCPQEVIKNEEVDIVCTGEGEIVLKELLDNNLNCNDVKGIWYKQGKKIIKNDNQDLIEDLDTLPFPDFKDYELEKYFGKNNNHLPMMTSRGCPYKCSYCSNHALSKKLKGKYVRFRSVDNVIEEIYLRLNKLTKRGLKNIYFHDETFILNEGFVIDFCKKFKEKGFHKSLKWNANVRADLVTEKLISTMKNAGCYEVRMGIEAGNYYIRNKIYMRNMTNKQILKAFQIIKKYGLQIRLYFIIGAPYETVEMMEESFDMAKKSNADLILFEKLLPLPGTKIKEMCEKENLTEHSSGRKFQNEMIYPINNTKFASKKEIQNFLRKIKKWQIRQCISEGISMNGFLFFWDALIFLLYYKHKYNLEVKQIYRWTVSKYKLNKL